MWAQSGFQRAAVKNNHPNDHLLKSSHTESQSYFRVVSGEKKNTFPHLLLDNANCCLTFLWSGHGDIKQAPPPLSSSLVYMYLLLNTPRIFSYPSVFRNTGEKPLAMLATCCPQNFSATYTVHEPQRSLLCPIACSEAQPDSCVIINPLSS